MKHITQAIHELHLLGHASPELLLCPREQSCLFQWWSARCRSYHDNQTQGKPGSLPLAPHHCQHWGSRGTGAVSPHPRRTTTRAEFSIFNWLFLVLDKWRGKIFSACLRSSNNLSRLPISCWIGFGSFAILPRDAILTYKLSKTKPGENSNFNFLSHYSWPIPWKCPRRILKTKPRVNNK